LFEIRKLRRIHRQLRERKIERKDGERRIMRSFINSSFQNCCSGKYKQEVGDKLAVVRRKICLIKCFVTLAGRISSVGSRVNGVLILKLSTVTEYKIHIRFILLRI
jgi:hypothetical protein